MQAELDPVHADAILAELDAMGLTANSTLIRHPTIPIGEQAGRPDDSFVWTDLVAEARVSSRAAPRYLALMAVAGIIAAMGILDRNTILIVGAMAVAPDLLPIVAACVGLAGRRPRLFARGFLSLAAGMAMASFAAGTVTLVLVAIGWTERSIVPEVTFIGSLLSLNITSVIIATAAGVAGDARIRNARERRCWRCDLGHHDPRGGVHRRGARVRERRRGGARARGALAERRLPSRRRYRHGSRPASRATISCCVHDGPSKRQPSSRMPGRPGSPPIPRRRLQQIRAAGVTLPAGDAGASNDRSQP